MTHIIPHRPAENPASMVGFSNWEGKSLLTNFEYEIISIHLLFVLALQFFKRFSLSIDLIMKFEYFLSKYKFIYLS